MTPSSPSPVSESSSEMELVTSDAGNINAAPAKKPPAWSKPSNSVVGVGPIMDAISWPALSESARVSPRPSSDGLKPLSEGSDSLSQGSVISPSPQQITNNENPNFNPNNTIPSPQKGGGITAVLPPPSLDIPPQQRVYDNGIAATAAASVPDFSPREHSHKIKNNNGESGSKEPLVPQFHNGNSHQRGNSYRRGNGPQPRGDGGYHNSYVNRRDHDRPNYEWNTRRNISGRGGHVQQERFVPRSFHRPQPLITSPVFVNSSTIRPFGNSMGYPEMSSPYFFVPSPSLSPEPLRGGVQYVVHAAPPEMYYPQHDPQLLSKLMKQIDYYFSAENLCKDHFLRKNMDENGWVSISLIAGFPRVKQLTIDTRSILAAVQTSAVVEVHGEKIRRRNDWKHWVFQPSNQFTIDSDPLYLAARMQSVRLDGTQSDQNLGSTC